MGEWSEADPAAGDLTALRSIAGYLGVSQTLFESLGNDLRAMASDLAASWSGEGYDAFAVGVESCLKDLKARELACKTSKDVLKAYVKTVEELKAWQDELVRTRGRALGPVAGKPGLSVTGRDFFGDIPGRIWVEVVGAPGSFEGLEGVAAAAEMAYNATYGPWTELISQRRTADTTLSNGIEGAIPTWGDELAAWHAHGVMNPVKMVPTDLSVGAAGRESQVGASRGMDAATLLDGKGHDGLADELSRDLSGLESPEDWAGFFTYCPPSRLTELLTRYPQLAKQAGLFSDGLATYSATLDRDERVRLGEDLVGGAGAFEDTDAWEQRRAGSGPVTEVSQNLTALLDDPALPVEVFAGAAVALDLRERIEKKNWRNVGVRAQVVPNSDPMTVVFKGLARDQRAALDFLNPAGHDDVAQARIEYYIGRRRYQDGFESAAILLKAATGPGNNNLADEKRSLRAGQTIAYATDQLPTRFDLHDQNRRWPIFAGQYSLTDEAKITLTEAYEPWVPDLYRNMDGPPSTARIRWGVNSSTIQFDQLAKDGRLTEDKWGPERVTAFFNPRTSMEVIAAVSDTKATEAMWVEAAIGYRDDALDAVISHGGASASITRTFAGEQYILGSIAAGKLDRAETYDEGVDAAKAAISAAVGEFPLVGSVVAATGDVLDQAGCFDALEHYDRELKEATSAQDQLQISDKYALRAAAERAGEKVPAGDAGLSDWYDQYLHKHEKVAPGTKRDDLSETLSSAQGYTYAELLLKYTHGIEGDKW